MKVRIFQAVIFITTAFFSCKKYPDGPSLSFRSPTQRLIGKWELKEYRVDGVDSMSIFSNCHTIPGLDFKDPNRVDSAGFIIRGGIDTANYVTSIGLYELTNHKKNLVLHPSTYVNDLNLFSPLISTEDLTFDILRLTHKEFWIEIDFHSRHYEKIGRAHV